MREEEIMDELIQWLNSECPSVAPPLEPYDNSDLSHNFCECLRIKLDAIKSLTSQIEGEKQNNKSSDYWKGYDRGYKLGSKQGYRDGLEIDKSGL